MNFLIKKTLLGVCEEAIVGRRIRKCLEEGNWKALLFTLLEKKKTLEGAIARRKGRRRKKEKMQYYYKKEKKGGERRKRSFVVGVGRDATR